MAVASKALDIQGWRSRSWRWTNESLFASRLEEHRIDVIYTTANPYSTHLVGYMLKRKTGIPWVADFRDEWAQHLFSTYPTRLHRWLNERLERMVVLSADRVIGVSQPVLDTLKVNGADPAKFSVITNGFDGCDIDRVRAHVAPQRNSHFRLCHMGTFYGPRRPDHFLAALKSVLTQGHIKPEEIRVRFLGDAVECGQNGGKWQEVVESPGYLEHLDALAELQKSDCLLLFMPFARTYPGNVFEYIAMRKPILAMIPPGGPTARLMRESRTGVVVPFDNAQAIASALLDLFTKWKSNRLVVRPDEQVIQRYERRTLTSQLAETLDQIGATDTIASA